MGRLIACTALLGLALVPVSPRASDIYSYVDEQGVTHFTNAPSDKRYRRVGRIKTTKDVHEVTVNGAKRPPSRASVAIHRTKREYDEHIAAAAKRYQLPEALLRAVMVAESNFNPRAVSRKGAAGLMQLMPATAKEMYVADVWDPAQNIEGGARYLRILANQYDGDVEKTLAAYNAGPEAVRRAGGVPNFPETREYVRKVIELYLLFTERS